MIVLYFPVIERLTVEFSYVNVPFGFKSKETRSPLASAPTYSLVFGVSPVVIPQPISMRDKMLTRINATIFSYNNYNKFMVEINRIVNIMVVNSRNEYG